MSRAEQDAWQKLRTLKAEGVDPTPQHKIGRYTVDFAIRKLRMAIEIDGKVHDLAGRREQDALPQQRLESLGWRFIRIPARLTRNPDAFLDAVRRHRPLPLRGGGGGSGETPHIHNQATLEAYAERSAKTPNDGVSHRPLTPSPKEQNLGKRERRTRAHRKFPSRRAKS